MQCLSSVAGIWGRANTFQITHQKCDIDTVHGPGGIGVTGATPADSHLGPLEKPNQIDHVDAVPHAIAIAIGPRIRIAGAGLHVNKIPLAGDIIKDIPGGIGYVGKRDDYLQIGIAGGGDGEIQMGGEQEAISGRKPDRWRPAWQVCNPEYNQFGGV